MSLIIHDAATRVFDAASVAEGDVQKVKSGTGDWQNALVRSITPTTLTLTTAPGAPISVTPGKIDSGAVQIEDAEYVPSPPVDVVAGAIDAHNADEAAHPGIPRVFVTSETPPEPPEAGTVYITPQGVYAAEIDYLGGAIVSESESMIGVAGEWTPGGDGSALPIEDGVAYEVTHNAPDLTTPRLLVRSVVDGKPAEWLVWSGSQFVAKTGYRVERGLPPSGRWIGASTGGNPPKIPISWSAAEGNEGVVAADLVVPAPELVSYFETSDESADEALPTVGAVKNALTALPVPRDFAAAPIQSGEIADGAVAEAKLDAALLSAVNASAKSSVYTFSGLSVGETVATGPVDGVQYSVGLASDYETTFAVASGSFEGSVSVAATTTGDNSAGVASTIYNAYISGGGSSPIGGYSGADEGIASVDAMVVGEGSDVSFRHNVRAARIHNSAFVVVTRL